MLLRGLGYPELSVGDAYKACLLVDAVKKNTSALGRQTIAVLLDKVVQSTNQERARRKSNRTAEIPTFELDRLTINLELDIWRTLIESLHAANACGDSLNICQDAVEKFPGVQWFRRTLELTKEWHEERTRRGPESLKDVPPEWGRGLHDGGVLLRQYPWMTADILHREPKFVFEDAQKELESASSKCAIRQTSVPSTRTDQSQSKPDPGVFGLFVTQDIRKHETILIDKTDLCATNTSDCCQNCCDNLPITTGSVMTCSCCGARYCSQDCSARALRSHHRVLCGKDFSFIKSYDNKCVYGAAPGGSVEALFWVRLLGIVVQESAPHPLKTSIIARLTRQYGADFTIGFNLTQQIVMPIRIMQTLGIDVFANPKFDMWVLQTIRAHIFTNYITVQLGEGKLIFGGGKPLMAVMRLYPFQNHSCEPNVHERFDDNGSTMTIYAQRDMKAGEELMGMYLNHIDGYNMPRKERQAKLLPWFAGPCQCERCVREEALESEPHGSSSGMTGKPV